MDKGVEYVARRYFERMTDKKLLETVQLFVDIDRDDKSELESDVEGILLDVAGNRGVLYDRNLDSLFMDVIDFQNLRKIPNV